MFSARICKIPALRNKLPKTQRAIKRVCISLPHVTRGHHTSNIETWAGFPWRMCMSSSGLLSRVMPLFCLLSLAIVLVRSVFLSVCGRLTKAKLITQIDVGIECDAGAPRLDNVKCQERIGRKRPRFAPKAAGYDPKATCDPPLIRFPWSTPFSLSLSLLVNLITSQLHPVVSV